MTTSPVAAHRASWVPILPREHGGWAMLLIPLVVGLAVAGKWGLEGPLFLLTCLSLYVARQPLLLLLKVREGANGGGIGRPLFWLLLYASLTIIFGLPLLYLYGRWLLLPWAVAFLAFSALHLLLRKGGLDRTVPAELLTIAGLALTAPGAYYVAKGSLEITPFFLWLFTTLYSGSSVFYVRMKMRQRALRRVARNVGERLALGQASILYQGVLALALAATALLGQVPPLVPLAFVPLFVKVAHAVLWGGPLVNIKRVGWLEVAHSLGFTFLFIAAYLVAG